MLLLLIFVVTIHTVYQLRGLIDLMRLLSLTAFVTDFNLASFVVRMLFTVCSDIIAV